ncbi:Uncharacterised protein [Escherichia coli]|nr:Uncharacterised protein [Escherichia coli]
MAIAEVRSSGAEKYWRSNVRELGNSNAAPIPCAARIISSQKIEGAMAQKTEAKINTMTPLIKVFLDPSLSTIVPELSINAANTSA